MPVAVVDEMSLILPSDYNSRNVHEAALFSAIDEKEENLEEFEIKILKLSITVSSEILVQKIFPEYNTTLRMDGCFLGDRERERRLKRFLKTIVREEFSGQL